MGAEAAIAPTIELGYLNRIHAASMPMHEERK